MLATTIATARTTFYSAVNKAANREYHQGEDATVLWEAAAMLRFLINYYDDAAPAITHDVDLEGKLLCLINQV